MSADLFTPVRLGALELPNRVLMAPLTRCRAGEGNAPTELIATYYAQRAGAGLIVSEATQVTPEGQGYPNTPGIHSDAQVEGWRRVTDAVHAAGGRIVLQLWHVGRVSHNAYQPGGAAPVAPSAVGLTQGEVRLPDGTKAPYPTPRALETDEIPSVVEAYRRGAANAKAAGFDGVEIHGANGYLIEQFLLSSSNRRTDRYGGSAENRARFLFEVADAVTGVWGGGERVGLRLSPRGADADRQDPDRAGLYGYVAERLNGYGLAFLHVVDPVSAEHPMAGPAELVGANPIPAIRERFRGPLVVNGGYDRASGDAAVAGGYAAVAYGIPFLANPDLPERLRIGAPLNAPDFATFYGGGAEGYTDYPTLAEGGAVK